MIRLRSYFSKFISVILAVVISFNYMMTPSYAEAESQTEEILDPISEILEQKEEVEADILAQSTGKSTGAGNWYVATKVDGLPYNHFHNAVQKKITYEYNLINVNKLHSEFPIALKYTDGASKGKLTGKCGRADIYLEKKMKFIYGKLNHIHIMFLQIVNWD